ncbi:MAG: MopE-related protein [Myxococcaceae bacterium]
MRSAVPPGPCNGAADCADSSCNGKVCGPFGRTCVSGQCACASATEICNDGIDNDCDGLVDCEDNPPCAAGTACTPGGKQCSGGACLCPGGQTAEATCADGTDNDCDSAVDCADSDCAGKACDPNGRTCQGSACVCPTGATELCADGLDNDCDGFTDCADSDCAQGATCGANGRTCNPSKLCSCPFGQSREVSCSDGVDNDCDGQVDCADPDCSGAQCAANGQSFCCGNSCVATTSGNDCGYCSATCATGRNCSPVPGSSPSVVSCSCVANGECLPNAICHDFGAGAKRCVECDAQNGCAAYPGRPVCNLNTFTCYCPPGQTCTPQCSTDATDAGAANPCTGTTPHCDAALTACVRCLTSSQCPTGQSCRNFTCQ